MTLAPGSRLGPYEITAKLGEGGMGEVYRAADTKLKREVAIKVLPAAFAEDKERLARFEREAQVLAQLHHPNIASIFGLEESDGVRALVMELVGGEELSSIIARGPMAPAEALPIARQIAEALEAAHERGIVHRDLKPANVKVVLDTLAGAGGTVKVLDFGLAKAMDAGGGASSAADAARSPTLMTSPTLTAIHGTQLGVILGTAAYMAPEQARGGAVDKRADIWSFGVLLFEMLSGHSPFLGDTVPDTLAAVLTREVDPATLPAVVPPAVRKLIRRCLERNPKNRLRDIGDARIALADAIARPEGDDGRAASRSVHPESPSASVSRFLPWLLASVALAFAAWAGLRTLRTPRAPHGAEARVGEITRLELGSPPGVEAVTGAAAGFAISPDGQTVALIGFREGQRRLYLRRLDRIEATEIESSSGLNAVTFSPDGASLVFVGGSAQLLRQSLVDQQRVVLATGADLRNSLSWGESGVYFQRAGELWRVPAAGGEAVRLTRLDPTRQEVLHTDPVEVPGSGRVLFANLASDPDRNRIESVALDDGQRFVLVEHASTPVVSATGHLLFERDGSVWAIALDPARATVSGRAVECLSAGSFAAPRYGSLAYRLSTTGTLAYLPREFEDKRILSVTRDGSERPLDLPPGPYSTPRVSPDGRSLLVENGRALEVFDFARGTRMQLVGGTFGTTFANWVGDGGRVVFRRFAAPQWVATDGSGRWGAIPSMSINDYPSHSGPDRDSFLFVRIQPKTAGDLVLASLSGAFAPRELLATPTYEGAPQISPDGHWLLYQSSASGRPEVYARRYPAMDRAFQISEGDRHPSRPGAADPQGALAEFVARAEPAQVAA